MMAFPLAVPLAVASAIPDQDVAPPPDLRRTASVTTSATSPESPNPSCLATTLCEIKDRVRWRTPAWKPAFCERIANAVLDSAKRYAVSPLLIVSVMINESDMNEKAFRTTMKNGRLYAKDGGLMGLRCIVDDHDRCVNGNVRGLAWSHVMDPVSNIDIGARELAYWRDGGGITRVTVRTRDGHGVLQTKQKSIPCAHKTHAFWAHYNHGPRYIDSGRARHYPHRIAVLYYALSRVMHVDTTTLTSMRLTVTDQGKRPRTADRPVEARYRKLCDAIRTINPMCGDQPTAQLQTRQ
jgi:hypothetical protein